MKYLNFIPDSLHSDVENDIKSIAEEKADMYTHGFGFLMFLLICPIMLYKAFDQSNWLFWGAFIFSFTILLTYLSSTIYHSSYALKPRMRFKVVDHICIYLLICGSYTPFILEYFRDHTEGLLIFTALLIMTLIGSILKIFYANRFKVLSTIIYVLMGWMAILIVNPLIERVGDATFYWIIIGGVSYTIGVVFYLRESLKYNHAIWHLFVIGGTLSHFLAVWNCLE